MDIEIAEGPPPLCGTACYRREFPSLTEEKNRAIEEVLSTLEQAQSLLPIDLFHLRLCLDEAIQNAISHGNLNDPRKGVVVSVLESDQGWDVVVRDEGTGFRREQVPDPSCRMALEAEGGRGILILKQYMDAIHYYEGGRTVVLTKKKSRPSP